MAVPILYMSQTWAQLNAAAFHAFAPSLPSPRSQNSLMMGFIEAGSVLARKVLYCYTPAFWKGGCWGRAKSHLQMEALVVPILNRLWNSVCKDDSWHPTVNWNMSISTAVLHL